MVVSAISFTIQLACVAAWLPIVGPWLPTDDVRKLLLFTLVTTLAIAGSGLARRIVDPNALARIHGVNVGLASAHLTLVVLQVGGLDFGQADLEAMAFLGAPASAFWQLIFGVFLPTMMGSLLEPGLVAFTERRVGARLLRLGSAKSQVVLGTAGGALGAIGASALTNESFVALARRATALYWGALGEQGGIVALILFGVALATAPVWIEIARER